MSHEIISLTYILQFIELRNLITPLKSRGNKTRNCFTKGKSIYCNHCNHYFLISSKFNIFCVKKGIYRHISHAKTLCFAPFCTKAHDAIMYTLPCNPALVMPRVLCITWLLLQQSVTLLTSVNNDTSEMQAKTKNEHKKYKCKNSGYK